MTHFVLNAALDPRAGRVDVAMPEIKFDPLAIVKKLEDLKYKKFTRVRNRKCIDRIVSTYKKFATGIFPIGIQKLKIDRDEIVRPDIEEKVVEMMEFENELYGKQRELKKLNKRKRKKIVADVKLYDEFQAKSDKVAKIKQVANAWTEEDITEDNSASEPPKKKKKKSKATETKSGESSELNENAAGTPKKTGKKHTNSEWNKPLDDGEVEYFIPSKKQQLNGVVRQTTTKDSVTTHTIETKLTVNGIDVASTANDTPKKTPNQAKVKKSKSPNVTPLPNSTPASAKKIQPLNNSPKSPKSSEKKVKSITKLAQSQSQTSTPKLFLDNSIASSSAEKRVKIALKMNQSQEVTEYIRQLKQSPHLPYDSAKKPSKGVLKPNLAPSPINPFYKRLIGIE